MLPIKSPPRTTSVIRISVSSTTTGELVAAEVVFRHTRKSPKSRPATSALRAEVFYR